MQTARDVFDGRAVPGKPFLYGSPDVHCKTILVIAPLKLFLKLRRKHVQKLGISRANKESIPS